MKPATKRKRRGQIIERGDGVYLIRVPLARDPVSGRRTYHNETYYGSRTKAEKRCTQLLSQIDDGSFFEPSNMTVGELLDRYLAHLARRGVRDVSLTAYGYKAAAYLRPPLGNVPLSRLTAVMLQDTFDAMKDRGLAPLTIRSTKSLLSGAFNFAVKLRLVRENLARLVETPKARRLPRRAMTPEEAARFLDAARKAPAGLPFVFWLYTGLRPAEFLGLKWEDLEMVKAGERSYGVAHVRRSVVPKKGGGWVSSEPKTERGKRPVYFPAWVYDDLMTHRRSQERIKKERGDYQDNGFVFAADHGGPLHRGNFSQRSFKPLLKSAGLSQEFSFYTLRRTFSSLLRRAGVSAREVSEQMGHTNTNFTEDVYVTVYDSAKQDMSDTLNEALISGLGTQVAHSESEEVM